MSKALNDKLSEIQQKLNAPKGQYNKFGGFAYRSCEDITEAVKPLLNGLALTMQDEIVMVGERYYIKATATLSDGTDSISVTAYAREPEEKKGMDSCQVTGATSSYARKYALNGLFAIDDAKDADTDEYGAQTGRNQGKQQRQPKQQQKPPQQRPQQQQAPQQGNHEGTTKATPEQILQRFSEAIGKINDEAELKEVYAKCWNMLPAGPHREQCQDLARIRTAEIKAAKAFKE